MWTEEFCKCDAPPIVLEAHQVIGWHGRVVSWLSSPVPLAYKNWPMRSLPLPSNTWHPPCIVVSWFVSTSVLIMCVCFKWNSCVDSQFVTLLEPVCDMSKLGASFLRWFAPKNTARVWHCIAGWSDTAHVYRFSNTCLLQRWKATQSSLL